MDIQVSGYLNCNEGDCVTVSVISSDPKYKNDNVRFTSVPLKPLSNQKCGRYKCPFSDSYNLSIVFLYARNAQITFSARAQKKLGI